MSTKFSVGKSVFYPAHGVAKIARVETRDIAGQKQSFFVLELSLGGNLLVPEGNIGSMELRPLISATKAKELLKKIKSAPRKKKSERKERVAQFEAALREGEADGYTLVIHDLIYRAREEKLTAAEEKLLEQGRIYFVSEVSTVLKRSADKIDEEITQLLPEV